MSLENFVILFLFKLSHGQFVTEAHANDIKYSSLEFLGEMSSHKGVFIGEKHNRGW